jgi:hypothetical protein
MNTATPHELANSCLVDCRRLHRSYKHKAKHFLTFVGLASALICYRRLAK